ncbi:MAG: STAS domain-containing protein [Planctomycetota bacterium]
MSGRDTGMDLDISESDGVLLVKVQDEDCGRLWEVLKPRIRGGVKAVVLDFSDVGYLNSTNIARVITLRNKLMDNDVGLLLGNVRDNIRSVFRILKLERLFNLELSTEHALAAARTR